MCGILGILLSDPSLRAAPEICEGLSLLQHRGQDACGVVTCAARGRLYQCKANGMVRDVFDGPAVSRLIGCMGVGHGMFCSLFYPMSFLPIYPFGCLSARLLTVSVYSTIPNCR